MEAASQTHPGRRSRLFDTAAFLAIMLAVGGILIVGKEVLVPLALAMLLSFALAPLVRGIQKIGAPRSLAIVLTLGAVVAAVGLTMWLLSAQVSEIGAQIPTYRTTVIAKIHAVADRFSGGGQLARLSAMVEEVTRQVAPARASGGDVTQKVVVVDESPTARLGAIGGYASPFLSTLAVAALVIILTAFMLSQREDLRNRLIKLIGAEDIERTTEAIDDAGMRVGRMLLAQLSLNTIFGAGVWIGLWFIGLPSAALWGVLAGIARFVPYFGAAVGLIPPLIIAFAFDPGWAAFMETLALFVVLEFSAGQIIEPILYGHSSGLSPVAIVISTAIWAFLWGVVGLVLAVPLTICLVVIGRHAPGLGFIETLLGDAPPLEPHEMFYQRMLAGDPSEALVQAKQFLKGRTLATYYDEIALEAVRRAQVDIVRGHLDGVRLEIMIVAMRDLIDRLGAYKGKPVFLKRLSAETSAALARSRQEKPELRKRLSRSELFDLWSGDTPIAIVHDENPLDAIAASMLGQAFQRQGLANRTTSLKESLSKLDESAKRVALVCLCFVEPLSLSHLRLFCVAARKACPEAKIMLCIWRDAVDASLEGKAQKLRADVVVSSISSALRAALGFAIASRRSPATEAERERSAALAPVGTSNYSDR